MGSRFILLIAGLGFALSACQRTGFTSSRQEALGKSVMSSNDDVSGEVRQDGGAGIKPPDGNGSGNVRQPPISGDHNSDDGPPGINADGTAGDITQPTYIGNPGNLSSPVERICSDSQSNAYGAIRPEAEKQASGAVSILINAKVCTTDSATVLRLAKQTNISVADLKAVCPAAVPNKGALLVTFVVNSISTPTYGGKFQGDGGESITMIWHNRTGTGTGDPYCTQSYSPLVIHVGADIPQPVSLSSRANGVMFDLLGARNGHRKVQISWFTNSEYRLLALPNAKGQVKGIDELFGDSTTGPDGKLSANGYAALAKYDGKSSDGRFQLAKPDGRIDRRDPVFHRLRLWQDLNFDGVAQADELSSLAENRLAYIDLQYSSDYSEDDQYGNATKFKSVVGYENGTLDLIFDLWFSVRDAL